MRRVLKWTVKQLFLNDTVTGRKDSHNLTLNHNLDRYKQQTRWDWLLWVWKTRLWLRNNLRVQEDCGGVVYFTSHFHPSLSNRLKAGHSQNNLMQGLVLLDCHNEVDRSSG